MNYKILSVEKSIIKDLSKGLRIIGNQNTVIHCHHYNARVQATIESQKGIDGKSIFRKAAEKVFSKQINSIVTSHPTEDKYALVEELYALSGYGKINFPKDQLVIKAPFSHFVEGWQCGSLRRKGPVCTLTEGYITAALYVITGRHHEVKETACANDGHQNCQFEILPATELKLDLHENAGPEIIMPADFKEAPSNINKQAVIEAVSTLPVYGNIQGLIPAFNVYLASTPQEFYNTISYDFVREMEKIGKLKIAQSLLIEDAEFCALNTFSGIMCSDEWKGLIAPMLKDKKDSMFGLVAIANALGWGRIYIRSHIPAQHLELACYNGYEAYGYLKDLGNSLTPQCLMLNGVSSGLMSLVYQTGEFEDRIGLYNTEETKCLTQGHDCCFFKVDPA